MTGAAERLSRLLALVPYLLNRQGIELDRAAADVGISPAQLVKDLELLFLCGLPGHLPGDLIEADWESGRVYLGNADAIDRPLRLSVDEVASLLIGLRLLAGLPGGQGRSALESATAKLSEAAGSVLADVDTKVGVHVVAAPSGVAEGAARALRTKQRIHLRYWVPWRDEITERDVDPMRLSLVAGQTYLEGWCRRAGAVRMFRLDRVVALQVLDIALEIPAEAQSRELTDELFVPSDLGARAVFRLTRHARWVTEYYPCEILTEAPDGSSAIALQAGDPEWLVRLALRLGSDGQLVEPVGLAEEVARRARATLAAYGEPVPESCP